ncbi:MAG TPA: amidase family protein [Frankiaceae bacterium]|nr:amidase family protein [Frankiaceae bacterium]
MATHGNALDAIGYAGVAGLAERLGAGSLTSVALVTELLERVDRLDPQLHAFVELRREAVLEEAAAADQARAAGDERPLLGIPIAVKNGVSVAGIASRQGTRSAELPAARDADVVSALRTAGCLILGVTTMPELALHPYGPARNPWDLSRTAGGSSSGSAAAVAAGLIPAATASDGGGSIRIPAASCGLFGLKPTPGLLPEGPERSGWHGLSALGFLTRSVADTGLLFDAVCATSGYGSAAVSAPDAPLRIAVSDRSAFPVRLAAACAEALTRTAERLAELGHGVTEVEPAYGFLAPAFIPRYLRSARDGAVRLVDPQLLSPAARVPARLGQHVSLEAVKRARRRGEQWAELISEQTFGEADVLLTPALPSPADAATNLRPSRPWLTSLRSSRRSAYTTSWNVAGFPAASVPAGFTEDGLPLAVQLVALPGRERTLLSLAGQLQHVFDWTAHRPPL